MITTNQVNPILMKDGMVNMNKMHPKLQQELTDKAVTYHKVSEFARLLPLFEGKIISEKLTGDEYCELGDQYKSIPLAWGINWCTNTPTNYPYPKCEYCGLVDVYISTTHLFSSELRSFASTELGLILPDITVHFYDALNTTFYFLPEEVEEGLEKLNNWYVKTKEKQNVYLRAQKKKELEDQLKKLSEEA
jgi:hypothetical protein